MLPGSYTIGVNVWPHGQRMVFHMPHRHRLLARGGARGWMGKANLWGDGEWSVLLGVHVHNLICNATRILFTEFILCVLPVCRYAGMYATRTYIIGTPRIVRLSVERFPVG